MKFEDKYTSESEKSKPENKDKKVITDDAYAIAEIINALINKIEHLRTSF